MNESAPNVNAEASDRTVVESVLRGEHERFAILMRRYNQLLFRLVRSIVRPDAEAEDALQDAYLTAFARLETFEGRARFSTWIARIAIRTANAHRERASRRRGLVAPRAAEEPIDATLGADPMDHASDTETRAIVEEAIDRLPALYRGVVVLRLVEGLSTAETAELLDATEEGVRIRLHRGRAKLRRALAERLDANLAGAFPFDGARCEGMAARVLARLPRSGGPGGPGGRS